MGRREWHRCWWNSRPLGLHICGCAVARTAPCSGTPRLREARAAALARHRLGDVRRPADPPHRVCGPSSRRPQRAVPSHDVRQGQHVRLGGGADLCRELPDRHQPVVLHHRRRSKAAHPHHGDRNAAGDGCSPRCGGCGALDSSRPRRSVGRVRASRRRARSDSGRAHGRPAERLPAGAPSHPARGAGHPSSRVARAVGGSRSARARPGRRAHPGSVRAVREFFRDVSRERSLRPRGALRGGGPGLLGEAFANGAAVYMDIDEPRAHAHARWYAATHDISQDRVVVLSDGGVPPDGSIVFGRGQACDFECIEFARTDTYWLARARVPS